MLYQDQPNGNVPLPKTEGSRAPSAQNCSICPVCEARFDRAGGSNLPFCSLRCRQIDLGRWLNESYGLPYENDDRPMNEQAPSDEE